MARKVFISFLGANPYGDCHYVKPGSDYEITNPYIQIATLDYLNKHVSKWEKGDIALFLLTSEAERKNWISKDLRNSKTNEIIRHEYGLEERLAELNLPFEITPIKDLPEGDTVQETMTIFMKTFETLQEGDELYFDITHGFRFLPMLVMVLTNYSKFTKSCKVKWISYGKTLPPFKEGSIIDLRTLSVLQDWTTGAADFVDNGNVDKLTGLSKAEVIPILQETNATDDNAKKINNFTNKLDQVIEEIKMCRCLNVIEAKTIRALRQQKQEIDFSANVQPFGPIIEKIMDSLKDFSSETDVLNGIHAANWCLNHSLYQQAITYLQESIVSFICSHYNIDLADKEKRDIVSGSFDVLYDKIPEREWKLGKAENHKENLALYHRLIDEDYIVQRYYKTYRTIKDLRNNINHAGMRLNSQTAQILKDNIKAYTDVFSMILKDARYRQACETKKDIIRIINFSDCPLGVEEKAMLERLDLPIEIIDLKYPVGFDTSTEKSVRETVNEYVARIMELSGNNSCYFYIPKRLSTAKGKTVFSAPLKIRVEFLGYYYNTKLTDIIKDIKEKSEIKPNKQKLQSFINLSNHPSTNWNEEQRKAALEFGEIKDLPFPNIDENLDEEGIEALTDKYLEMIKELSGNEPCTVHIMGEMTFTYALVNKLKAEGYTCVASTSWRDVEIMPDGSKQVRFHFCRFRKY